MIMSKLFKTLVPVTEGRALRATKNKSGALSTKNFFFKREIYYKKTGKNLLPDGAG